MAKTREQLEKDIKALKDAGLDASAEEAELKQLVLAGSTASGNPPAEPAMETEEDFVPLNTESYKAGWKGGGWIEPKTTGVKDAVCEGYIIPDFVQDQAWFIFNSPEGAPELFRGALVCGALTVETGKSAAGKVLDVVKALGIVDQIKVVEGKGIRGLKACEGKTCQVLWEDIPIKGKTERRIQDVMAASAEPVM